MEDFGTTEVANDHRTKTSPDKRNMYLVNVTLLNRVTVDMAACSTIVVVALMDERDNDV